MMWKRSETEDEIAFISEALTGRKGTRLPTRYKIAFRAYLFNEGLRLNKEGAPMLMLVPPLLFLFFEMLTRELSTPAYSEDNLLITRFSCSAGVCLSWFLAGFSRLPKLKTLYHLYIIGIWTGLISVCTLPGLLFQDPALTGLAFFPSTIMILALFSLGIFHPDYALYSALMGVSASLGFAHLLGVSIDWTAVLVACVLPIGLGIIISKQVELRDIITFLQRRQLALSDQIKSYLYNEALKASTTDPLTELSNRGAFNKALEREWSRGRRLGEPLSIIFADIDHFKMFNDQYGHQAGDAALRSVAHILASSCNRPSDMAARFGGEEFVVLLPQTGAEGAAQVARAIIDGVRQLDIEHGPSPTSASLTISIGIATMVPQPGVPSEYLVTLADKALYAAKDAGRNRCIKATTSFSPQLTSMTRRDFRTEPAVERPPATSDGISGPATEDGP